MTLSSGLPLLVPADVEQLRPLPIFAGIPERAREKVLEKIRRYIHPREVEAGTVILRAGDYTDAAYYIVGGSVEVTLSAASPTRPQVRGAAPPAKGSGLKSTGTVILTGFPAPMRPGETTVLEAGEMFGEISALSRYALHASVRARTPVRMMQIRLQALRMLSAVSPEFKENLDTRYRERTLAGHLRQVELFASLDDAVIARLCEHAGLLSFEPGRTIVTEGEEADALYLVRGGYVKVSVRVGSGDLAVTYLRKGDSAGEAALMTGQRWPYSLQAIEHVELVRIDRDDYAEIVERHPEVQDKLWEQAAAALKRRGAVMRNPRLSEHVQMSVETGLIHGESVLLIDLDTCTGCDDCVRGCASAHGGVPRFMREGQTYRNWLIPAACYQCTDPVCMIDCPTGAIARPLGTLEVSINADTCIGCGNCGRRCPWDNIVLVETGAKRPDGTPVEVATKCDLCVDRAEGPACVQMCPHGSAVRVSFKDLSSLANILT